MSSFSRPASAWACAALLFLACPAEAASGKVRLSLASKPVRAALLDLALQADLSLGGDLERCRGRAPAISARLRVDEALDRVLAGSGCVWRRLDADTIFIGPAAPLHEQAARPASPVTAPSAMGEVIVTAQRQPNLPGRTPFALSVVSRDQVRREGLHDIGDLEGEVAGLSTTHLGPGRDKIILRGLSDGAFTGQTQSIVALYLDETPVTYSAPNPNLRLADVERVEVLRGPQGTLYGGGSIGGVVRIVTRKPDLDETTLDVTAGLSATGGGGGLGREWEASANLPLVPGRLALRAVGYDQAREGYIANPALGLSRVNAATRRGGRLSLRAQATPDWSLTLGLTRQSIRTDDTQYGLRRLGPLLRDNRVREPHDNHFTQASLTLSGEGAWGQLTASAARLGHRFESRYDASLAAWRFGLPPGPAAFDEARKTALTVAEITYATPSGGRLSGLAGAFVSAGESHARNTLQGLDGPRAYGEVRNDDIREAALYGEATLKLSPALFLTAGLRWFDYGLDASSRVTQGSGERRFDGAKDESGFSPKLLAGWTPMPDLLVYAQAAEGYRAGGFNTGGRLSQGFDNNGEPARRYRPDALWNYEAGVKARGLDGRLQTRLAVFEADWTSIQSDQHLADGLAYTANVGSGHNLGLEIETSWRVGPRLDLRAAALVSNPSLKRRDPALDARDVALAGINGASASFAFDYHRPLAGGHRLRLQGSLRYVGHGRLDLSSDGEARAPDYVEGAASLAWEAPRWSLGLHVDNLFDRRADSFGFGNPFNGALDPVVTSLPPRTIGLRASARF